MGGSHHHNGHRRVGPPNEEALKRLRGYEAREREAAIGSAGGTPKLITNPSGVILGGDRLEMDDTLAPGSAATLLTQAANKVYKGAEARQNATFRVGEGSFLEYLPHHLIPFARSSYRQETEIHLAADATLVAWDAVSAGRAARGERFAFDGASSRTRIFRENLPKVVDGFELCAGGEPFGGLVRGSGVHPRTAAGSGAARREAARGVERASPGAHFCQRPCVSSLCCPGPGERRHRALPGAERMPGGGAGLLGSPARAERGMVGWR